MGLRFRKSISIIPGVKLNIGTTGMSVSAGVPGFRKTFHTSGRVTTSVGIPGTGLYYVDTNNTRTQNSQRRTTRQQALPSGSERVNYIPEYPNNNYSESRSSVSHDNAISVSERVEQLDIKQVMIRLIGLRYWYHLLHRMKSIMTICGSITTKWHQKY